MSERYPTLRAFLEADAKKIKSLRQYSQSFVPAHHSVSSQECVTSTTSSDGKRKKKDDDNKPRKKWNYKCKYILMGIFFTNIG